VKHQKQTAMQTSTLLTAHRYHQSAWNNKDKAPKTNQTTLLL